MSSLRISNNRICCINYSLQRLISVIYNWYIDTKEGIQVIQVAFLFLFLFMADRSMHCVMLNNQSFQASMAGGRSRDLQANGVCAVSGQAGLGWGLSGLCRTEVPKGCHPIMLFRLVQLNSIKTKPKENLLFAFHFSSCDF